MGEEQRALLATRCNNKVFQIRTKYQILEDLKKEPLLKVSATSQF